MASEPVVSQAEQGAAAFLHSLTNSPPAFADSWRRMMHSLFAMLRQSQIIIERAAATIATQERRIAQLQAISTTDELTGLKNRRGFYETFVAEIDRCDRGILPGGLLMLIDLDNFKAVNDTHGHLAGDACLRLVAETLMDEIRVMDSAARLGGDEFLVLLSTASRDGFAARAQKIEARLNRLMLEWQGHQISIRVSIGLRSYKNGDSAETILNCADNAMYANKRRKRERRSRSKQANAQLTGSSSKAFRSRKH